MNDLRIRTMRPDEIAIAIDWAAAEGWNPGLADAACFSTVDADGALPDFSSCADSALHGSSGILAQNRLRRKWRASFHTAKTHVGLL